MKYKRLLCLALAALMTLSVAAFSAGAASGWVTLLEQGSFESLAKLKEVYTAEGESDSSGEMLLQDGKPSLKRLGTMNAGGNVVMKRDIQPLDNGKYTIYIDTKQVAQGNYRILLQDEAGNDKYRVSRSYYGDIQVQKAADASVATWGPEMRNAGAATDEKALFSLKLVVDAGAGTVSAYGKGTPSNATKNPSGALVPDYNAAEKDSEGYVTILENVLMDGSENVAKIAFRLEKSTKETPAGAQMTVESIRIKQEVTDVFQYDKDYLTETLVLNGQDKAAVTGTLNLPKTLPGGTTVTWEATPADVIDTDTGEVTPPENGSTDVALTAHLTENVQESPRTDDVVFQLTVVATKNTLLNQTTYGSEEAFLADYTVAGAEGDATVGLTDGKPTIVRKAVNSGGLVEITRNLPEMTTGVYAIYADVRQAYQGSYHVQLLQDGEPRAAITRNYWGNLQSKNFSGFTFPCQFRSTAGFGDSKALLQYKFIYAADTGRVQVYLKGTPTSETAQYAAMEKEEEGYVLFHEDTIDIGAGNSINQILFQSEKGAKDKANQSGMQVERVRVDKINYDIFSKDVAALTEDVILGEQEKTEVRTALNLPQVLPFGTPVVWSAEPQGIIDPATGEVTRPQRVDTDVTLTAEINEAGGAARQETKMFTVKVISEETDNPKPQLGWQTILEQPSYADEAEMKTDYDMPVSGDVKTGLYNGAPYIIRTVANNGANASMTRELPRLEQGRYTVYVDTLQAYRGSFNINLKSGTTSRFQINRNHFGNIQCSGYTPGYQFRGTGEFDAAAALLSYKFVIDADLNTVNVYLKGTPTNGQAIYNALAPDEEGYRLYKEDIALTGSGVVDGLEITSVKGASSDTAGKSGVAVSGVTVKKELTSFFDADVYSLTEAVVLNGQNAQEIRNTLNLATELQYGTKVQWSAQPAGVIDTTTGAVTRAEEVNTPVTLTATLTEQGVEQPRTETKVFQLLVLNLKADREAQAILDFDKKVLEAGEFLSAYKSVKLPLHGAKGSDIQWSSNSGQVKIAADGKAAVTKPETDTAVTLTATLKKGMVQTTKDFTFTLRATDEAAWDTSKAANNITAATISNDDLMALASLKQLPQTDAETGAEIEWVSSNTDLLNPQTGTLNRPAGADEMVQLYAVVTKTGECLRSKAFMVNVLGQRQGLHYFMEETFENDAYTQNGYWTFDGSAQRENGKLVIAGGNAAAALVAPAFYNNRYASFHMEFTPADAGVVRFLDAASEPVFEAAVEQVAGGWALEYNGSRAYTVTQDGAQRFFVGFDADLKNQTLQINVNGNVLATAQPLPQGAELKTVELSAAGSLDNVKSYTLLGSGQDSVLHMIAGQADAAMITGQPAEAVTKDVMLSTEPLAGIGCGWTSSAPDIIAEDGTVTRKNGNGADTVTLTAAFYLKNAPEQKEQAQIVLQVPQVGDTGVNFGKSVYSNAEPLQGSSLENVMDGTPLSAFITDGFGDATEILFHLGGEVSFNRIIMQEQKVNEAYNIAEAVVEISNDRSVWTKIAQKDNVGERQDITLDQTVTATYVRFSFSKAADGPIAVAELTVARGGALGGPDPQTDLEDIMAKLPANFYLTTSFTLPLAGPSGCEVTVTSSNDQAAKVTKGSDAWQVTVMRMDNTDQTVVITVKCTADGASPAEKSRTYNVPKLNSSSGSNGGGGGGNSGGGSGGSGGGGGGAVVPQPTATARPTDQPQPTPSAEAPFADMGEAQWAIPYVQQLKELGAVSGDLNGNFYPNNPASREEFVKILVSALGGEIDLDTDTVLPFTDVEADAWYYPYLVKAYELNLIQGVSETEFGIGQTISRQDMATVIYRQIKPQQAGTPESAFADSSQIADWAKEAVSYLESAGVLSGDEQGNFNPWNATTKAEIAKVVCSIIE